MTRDVEVKDGKMENTWHKSLEDQQTTFNNRSSTFVWIPLRKAEHEGILEVYVTKDGQMKCWSCKIIVRPGEKLWNVSSVLLIYVDVLEKYREEENIGRTWQKMHKWNADDAKTKEYCKTRRESLNCQSIRLMWMLWCTVTVSSV